MEHRQKNGVVTERVSSSNRDWEALRRKISAGTLPEIAAEEVGIPWEEAAEWFKTERKAADYDDDMFRAVSGRMLERAIDTLEEIAAMREGRESSQTSSVGAGLMDSSSKVYHDVEAAKALLDGAVKLRRLVQAGKKKEADAPGRDLFDRPAQRSPWSFRKAD